MDEKLSAKSQISQVYQVPTEITNELKLKGTIPLTFIAAAFLMFFFAQRMEGTIYAPFRILWYVYNVVVAIIMCVKTKKNKEKRFIQSILIYLTKNNNYYAPIDNPANLKDMEVPKKDET